MANVLRDEQVVREVVDAANSSVREQQVVREVAKAASSSVQDFQVFREVIILAGVRDEQVVRELVDAANANVENFQVVREVIISPPAGRTLQVVRETIFLPAKHLDKPSIQLHPLRKPLSFASRPLTQPGKSKASFTVLLTEAGANQAFSMPMGARNQPIAGKVFSFTMGGIMTAGASDGTLVITPFYGASVNGVNLGPSLPQAYSAGTLPVTWRLKGEIIFRRVDLTPGACLVVCTGSFALGSSSLVFGSAVPIQIDASAVTPIASGALNFAATFAPARLNAVPPTIYAKYALLR